MDADRVYALLQEACRRLEEEREYAISAYVGHAMAMIESRYGVGHDHLAQVADAG